MTPKDLESWRKDAADYPTNKLWSENVGVLREDVLAFLDTIETAWKTRAELQTAYNTLVEQMEHELIPGSLLPDLRKAEAKLAHLGEEHERIVRLNKSAEEQTKEAFAESERYRGQRDGLVTERDKLHEDLEEADGTIDLLRKLLANAQSSYEEASSLAEELLAAIGLDRHDFAEAFRIVSHSPSSLTIG